MNPVIQLQQTVAELLRADADLQAAGVEVFAQDDADILEVLQERLERVERPILVIAVDRVANFHPGIEIGWSLIATEVAPLNREHEGFKTALDTVWTAVKLLDGAQYLLEDITHSITEDGVFQAIAKFKTIYHERI